MVSAGRLVLVLAWACTSCANYAERLEPAHAGYYGGQLNAARTELEGLIEAADDESLPLLKLELASVLQASGDYQAAANLLIDSDSWFEVLDYTNSSVDDIAEFAFSTEGTYRVNPPEKVMINTQNMINHLAMGDTEGAAVEARRLSALLDRDDLDRDELAANSLAWGLAGVALEARGRVGEADEIYNDLPDGHPLIPSVDGEDAGMGTIVVVCQLGMAPRRREVSFIYDVDGCPNQLNLPVLQPRPSSVTGANFRLDGVDQGQLPLLFDLGQHLMQRYQAEYPLLLAAAVTQVVTRSFVSDLAGSALASGSTDNEEHAEALGNFLGCLFQFLLANTLNADVRCWSLLPGRYHAMRVAVEPGQHTVELVPIGGGKAHSFDVEVRAGEITLVNLVSGPDEGYRYLQPPAGRNVTEDAEMVAALGYLAVHL